MTRFNRYQKKLFRIAAEKKLWLRVLGDIDGHPIWLLRIKDTQSHNYPRLLIVGGFHGEEQAGPLGILSWLEAFDPNLYQKVNLSFVPIVNPAGFNKCQRYNDKGEKTNCGFCHPESGDSPSREGIILLKHFPLLKASAKHGFLSLHEDVTTTKSYLYSFERMDEPGGATRQMLGVLTQYFPELLDDEWVVTDAKGKERGLARDGIVWKLCDGSFEDYLFHEGSLRCFVTETPAKNIPIKKRILASQAIITEFINISI
jgi:hypothetical protein